MRIEATLLLFLCSSTAVAAFCPSRISSQCSRNNYSFLYSTTDSDNAVVTTPSSTSAMNDSLEVPLTYNEMITQTSAAMTEALTTGRSRQLVRILLPRDATNDNFGVFQEAEAQTDSKSTLASAEQIKLVPTDESWQGGIMQLYRAAAPTCKDILRLLSPTMREAGVPPKIVEDRSIDESGVDGVGLMYTQIGKSGDEVKGEDAEEGGGGMFGGFGFGGDVELPTLSEQDMCVFIQPNQEVIDSIETLSIKSQSNESSSSSSSPLIALINPQWRNVDDALDSASKNDNVFGAFASFLGGKGNSLKRLDTLGYENIYTLEGYVCKGGNIRLLKRFDSDWIVFAENDAGDAWVRVGEMKDRPRYQDVEKFLDDKGVGYKYARDLGMAPKL